MEVRRVAECAGESGAVGDGVVDGEVVEQRTEQAGADSAPEHDHVGVGCWHARTVSSDRVNRLHLAGNFTG